MGEYSFKFDVFASDPVAKYKKRLLLRCLHHFKSDLILKQYGPYAHIGYRTLVSYP